MADSRGLAVPVNNLGAVTEENTGVISGPPGIRPSKLAARVARSHLLVVLLVAPVRPHLPPVDARQGDGAAEQHHVHRLLSVPEALFFAALAAPKDKTGELTRRRGAHADDGRVGLTRFCDVELNPDHLVQVAVEVVEVAGVQASVVHRHVCGRGQKQNRPGWASFKGLLALTNVVNDNFPLVETSTII